MDDNLRLALLFDYYGDLLKENQKEVFNSFVFYDLSLSEIAEQQNISRQAVHDMVKRCIHSLEYYEEKLKLLEQHEAISKKAEKLKGIILDDSFDIPEQTRDNLLDMVDEIVEMA